MPATRRAEVKEPGCHDFATCDRRRWRSCPGRGRRACGTTLLAARGEGLPASGTFRGARMYTASMAVIGLGASIAHGEESYAGLCQGWSWQ